MKEPSQIAAELDEMHTELRVAFERRDLARYREVFAPRLKYQQADGHVIDRRRLMRDVAAQFRSLSWIRSSFVREHIEIGEDHATEVLTQTASGGVTVFFIVHRTWYVTRRGRYIFPLRRSSANRSWLVSRSLAAFLREQGVELNV